MKKNQKLPTLILNDSMNPVGIHAPPTHKKTAFLLSSPHSGRNYPQDFLDLTVLPLSELQRMEDRFTDELLQNAPAQGLYLIQALFPRSFCDVNRDWRELDAAMFTPPLLEEELISSPKVKAGYGVIPRCASPGKGIYRYCLPVEEVEKRLSHYWKPYHNALQSTQNTLVQEFGFSVLLDIHSMPPLAQTRPCDIVLGDCHGQACSSDLTAYIEELFVKKGYHVQRNTPYPGGYITSRYGTPQTNRHSLQIEINRACYLNLQTLQPNRNFVQFQQDIMSILHDVTALNFKP